MLLIGAKLYQIPFICWANNVAKSFRDNFSHNWAVSAIKWSFFYESTLSPLTMMAAVTSETSAYPADHVAALQEAETEINAISGSQDKSFVGVHEIDKLVIIPFTITKDLPNKI